jgi:glutathione peroxidase
VLDFNVLISSVLDFFIVRFAMLKLMTRALALMGVVVSAKAFSATECPVLFKGEFRKLHSQQQVDLCELTATRVVLVVNTASHCGFTSQFKGLEALHQRYKDEGLVVVGFASDDFKQEANDEAEAAEICFLNFGVSFTMLAPTHVRGAEANSVFVALAQQTKAPSWNFNKYLVDQNGKVLAHFGSMTKPDSPDLSKAIEAALKPH